MELRKIISTILIISTAAVFTVSATRPSEIVIPDVTDLCKKEVVKLRDMLKKKAEEKHVTSLVWDFWQCLGDTEIFDDANALCDILGSIFKNASHFHMVKDHFIEKQMHAACDLCDQAATHVQGLTDQDIKLALNLVQTHIRDPKLAKAVQEHGPVLVTKLIESLYPHETCSFMASQCDQLGRIPIPQPIKDFVKEVLGNVTHCLECNLCEAAVLFAQMHILPNPKLPNCTINLVEENVCVMLNQTIPGIGNQGYELCVEAINNNVGDIISGIWTFLHPNLVCKTALKACTPTNTDNILECVCDNVRLPSFLEWAMPCHWQHEL